jgi:hypothetical protein
MDAMERQRPATEHPDLAGEGGGLFLSAGTISLANSTLSVNTAVGGRGGNGFFVECHFPPPTFKETCNGHSGNGAAGGTAAGGGLYVLSGSMQLLASSISGNKAEGGDGGGGGGIEALPSFTSCCLTAGDGGAAKGGGLFLAAGTLNFTQTTVSDNSGTGGNGGVGGLTNRPSIPVAGGGASQGAGMFVANGDVSAINSTVSPTQEMADRVAFLFISLLGMEVTQRVADSI